MAKLGEIFDLQMGKTPSRNKSNYWTDGQYSWVSIADLGTYQKYVGATKEEISEVAVRESGIKSVPSNTVIMSFKLSLGKTAITKEEVYTNEAIMAFIPTGKYDVLPDYFYHLFTGKDWSKETNRAVMGATLNKAMLSEISVPVPLIDEQRKIAAVLDKVSDLIAKRRQQLDKLDLLVKSKFVEMFGDPVVNSYRFPMVQLGSVLTVEPQNGLYKPQSDYVLDGSGTPILRIDGFYNGRVIDFRRLKRLLCSDDEIQKFLLHENDIVINRVNSIEYLGKCGLIQGLLEDTVYESNMMRLHIDESKFNVYYIVHLLCSQFVYNQILGRAKKSVNQASINQKDVQGLMVYMPPLALQNQFAAFVEQTEKTKTTISKSLEQLETLKKALMQEYFG